MTDEIRPRPDLFESRPRPILTDEEGSEHLAPFHPDDHSLMSYRNGLDRGGMPRSLDEVSVHFGISGGEARTAEAGAMARRAESDRSDLNARLRRKLFIHVVEDDSPEES